MNTISSHSIIVAGEKITYKETSNDGPTLLLVHGLASNAKAWLKLIPHLDKYHVIAINLPKYLDQDDKSKVGMKSYANIIAQFIETKGIDKVHYCGHSMGGQIGVHFSIMYPDKISKLILLAPAGIETFSEQDRAWFDTYITDKLYLSLTDAMIKRNFDINFYGSKLPDYALFFYQEFINKKHDSILYQRYIDYIIASIFSMLDEPVSGILSKVEVPTLILYGDDDQLIPNQILHSSLTLQDLKEQSTKINNSDFSVLAEAGHFIQWDQAKEVADRINIFLHE